LALAVENTMIDVTQKRDCERLWKAIKRSDEIIARFDDDRTEMLRDYAGPLYSPYSRKRTTRYVNKLNTTATIYQMVLCFNNPQCKINSFNPKNWPFCRKYETNVNKVAANIDLRTTMQECVLDAFFLLGIAKVRMADSGLKEIEPNIWLDVGQPWVDRVSFSDAILDMPGRSLRSMRYYGDRYRASYDAVMGRDDYDSKVKAKITPSAKNNQTADSDRADKIAFGNAVDDDELEPMCWLMDIYLPGEKQLVTFSADNESLPPLKWQEWKGSDQGPYKFLPLGYMPDNVMPSTPAQQLVLLDRLMNSLYKKMADQAKRQKNFTLAQKGGEKDAELVKNAKDGEYLLLTDPKGTIPASTPGVDGNTHAFYLAAQEIYNVQSGNERTLGGLGTEADTATQEKMLSSGALGRIGFMKGAVNQFASEILREIGILMWDDETLTVESSMEAENTGYYVDSSWRPGDRQGLKDHYEFSVEPNTMAYRPPEAKLQMLKQFAADYLQMMPAIQAGIFDGQEFTKIYADYTGTPEILRISKQLQSIPEGAGGGDQHQATKPANTTREVVRSRGNGAPAGGGMAQVLGQMMQGRNSGQPKMSAMAGGG
jgi:hypothetical protein